MAENTEIAWCDSTFNPWIGCTKVGPGCDNCYAEADFDLRKHRAKWGPGNPRSRTSAANWKKPLQWNAKPFFECGCGHRGTMEELTTNAIHSCDLKFKPARRRVFCASLADVFDNEVPAAWRMDLVSLIANTPNLDWLLLTKRIGNVQKMSQKDGMLFDVLQRNVWLGATVCNQEEADRDIPKLLAVPARVRFLSMEPLLGPVALGLLGTIPATIAPNYTLTHERLHWVVVGGESGPKARPMQPAWVRSLRDQCKEASVAFLFKQWGEHDYRTIRMGKRISGRLLDSVLHNDFPEVR